MAEFPVKQNNTGTNISGTITTGGTAQQLTTTPTHGFLIQNISSGDLWINDVGASAAINGTGSIRLSPGAYFETPVGYSSPNNISIIGATTGQAFSGRKW